MPVERPPVPPVGPDRLRAAQPDQAPVGQVVAGAVVPLRIDELVPAACVQVAVRVLVVVVEVGTVVVRQRLGRPLGRGHVDAAPLGLQRALGEPVDVGVPGLLGLVGHAQDRFLQRHPGRRLARVPRPGNVTVAHRHQPDVQRLVALQPHLLGRRRQPRFVRVELGVGSEQSNATGRAVRIAPTFGSPAGAA